MTPERETPQEKAQRLINERKVARLAEGVYAIQGETGRYLTVVVPKRVKAAAARSGVPAGSCTCENGRSRLNPLCSHIRAANAVEAHVAEGKPYDVLELGTS